MQSWVFSHLALGGVMYVKNIRNGRSNTQSSISDSLEFLDKIIHTLHEPIIVLNLDFTVVSANQAFYQAFKLIPEDSIGRSFYKLGEGEWNTPELQDLLTELATQKVGLVNYEISCNFPVTGLTILVLKGSLVDDEYLLLALDDLSARKKAVKKLHATIEKFKLLMEITTDWIWEVDALGRYTYCSPAVNELLGYEVKEVLGKTPFDFMPEDEGQKIKEIFSGFSARKQAFRGLENLNLRKDGRLVMLETNASPILAKNGELLGYRGIDRDITEKKQNEEALRQAKNELELKVSECTVDLRVINCQLEIELAKRKQVQAELTESELKFKSLFDSSTDGIILVNSQTLQILMANPAFCRMLGYNREELSELHIEDLHLPQDLALVMDNYDKIMKQQIGVALDIPVKRKDGSIFYADITGSAFAIADKNYVMGSFRDVSEKQIFQEVLKNTLAYNRGLIEASFDPLVTIGPDGKITDVNHATEKATGLSREQLIGTEFSDYFTEPKKARAGYLQAFKDGLVRDYELELHNGIVMSVLYNATVDRDANGKIIGVFAAARDITKRKKSENLLKLEAQKGKILLDLYQKSQRLSDRELYALALEQAMKLTGSEIGFLHLISEDQKEAIFTTWGRKTLENCTAIYDDHYPLEKAGNWGDCVRSRQPIIYNDFPNSPNQKGLPPGHAPLTRFMSIPVLEGEQIRLILAVGNKLKPYEENDTVQIQLVVNELQKIIRQHSYEKELKESENKYRNIFELANDGIFLLDQDLFVDCNQRILQIFGCRREEIIGKTPYNFSPPIQPDGRDSTEKALEKIHAALAGEPQLFEWTHTRQDGSAIDTEVSLNSIQMGGKNLIHAVVRDISIRKQAEAEITRLTENLLVKNLELQNLNQELEAFSYSASHDLRSPLAKIDSYVQLILLDGKDKLETKHCDYLNRVHEICLKMAELIENLLSLSRTNRSEMKYEKVNLSQMAKSICSDLQQKSPERVVDLIIADGVVAEGDRNLLEIVLTNLLNNAWKFTSKHPSALIEFGVTELDGKPVYFVRDDGAGFDPAYKDRLFNPFKRLHTSREFPGSGIGLTMVQRIVNRHGGRIWIEGAIEQGATVYFTL